MGVRPPLPAPKSALSWVQRKYEDFDSHWRILPYAAAIMEDKSRCTVLTTSTQPFAAAATSKHSFAAADAGYCSLFQGSKHLFRVALGLYFGENLCNSSLRIDQKRSALDAHGLAAVQVLFFQHTESLAELLVLVGEQSVGKAIFVFELLLRVG